MRHTWRTSEEPITPLHRLRLEAMTTVSRERGERITGEGGGRGRGGGEGRGRGERVGAEIALYPSF